jgi:predicted dehydrogenase
VRCDWTAAHRKATTAAAACLRSHAMLGLFHECASLFDAAPVNVWATAADGAGFIQVLSEFGGGRVAQLNRWTGVRGRPACRLQVVADKGTVEAELPGDVHWRDREGRHSQRLARHPARLRLLERFFLVARDREKPRPDLAETYRALTWLRAAERSLDEGRKVVLSQ